MIGLKQKNSWLGDSLSLSLSLPRDLSKFLNAIDLEVSSLSSSLKTRAALEELTGLSSGHAGPCECCMDSTK